MPANVLECETASSAASSPSTETLLAGCGDAEIGEPDRVPTEGSAGVCGFDEEPRGF